jgi:AcrR family transcriptional regulator
MFIVDQKLPVSIFILLMKKVSARKESEKAELKAKILEAAREIVIREGFGALSLRKLAEKIGYAPGNIYLYFDGRDEIASEICRKGFAEMLAAIEPAASVKEPLRRLESLLKSYADFAEARPETYKLSFMQDPKFNEVMFRQTAIDEENGAGQKAFRLIVDALDELKQNGKIDKQANTKRLAEVLWAGVHGVVSLKLIYPAFPATPTPTLIRTMIRILLKGLLVER